MGRLVAVLFLFLSATLASPAIADQGSLINSGGSTAVGTGVTIKSNVAAPAGTLTLNCPATGSSACIAGNFGFLSTDGSTSISATFASGSAIESCSGGGRGGRITCYYTVTGN